MCKEPKGAYPAVSHLSETVGYVFSFHEFLRYYIRVHTIC